MAYFDNAATTYPKPERVYSFMDTFYRSQGGSAGRGQYALAQSAGALIQDTRKRLQSLLHCPAKQIVFEPTATIALNIIIQGMIQAGAKNIYISPFEHNAVTRTLHHFEKLGQITVHQLSVSTKGLYELDKIERQFSSVAPDFVIVSHASNVTGLIAPVKELFLLAKKHHAVTLVDMAQTAGLVDLNVGLEVIDFAVFDGHKTLYAPTGIAGFAMSSSVRLPAVLFGGTGYESANQDMPESVPERFEMGTLNILGVAGLNAALKWIEEISIEELREQENQNRKKLLELLQEFNFIEPVGVYEDADYVGIVSLLMDGISSDSAGQIFSECGIAVRSGLQCAPLTHQFLGTYPAGTIRMSVSYFTTEQDFDELRNALLYIEENL